MLQCFSLFKNLIKRRVKNSHINVQTDLKSCDIANKDETKEAKDKNEFGNQDSSNIYQTKLPLKKLRTGTIDL